MLNRLLDWPICQSYPHWTIRDSKANHHWAGQGEWLYDVEVKKTQPPPPTPTPSRSFCYNLASNWCYTFNNFTILRGIHVQHFILNNVVKANEIAQLINLDLEVWIHRKLQLGFGLSGVWIMVGAYGGNKVSIRPWPNIWKVESQERCQWHFGSQD